MPVRMMAPGETLISECNEIIKSSPLSIKYIYTEQEHSPDYYLYDLTKCINLEKLQYLEVRSSNPHSGIHHATNLNLLNCVKLTHLILTIENQLTFDTLDLTNCVNLIHISITSNQFPLSIKKLNLKNCVNLKHFTGSFRGKLTDSEIPDFTNCLKLEHYSIHNGLTFVELNLKKFPNIIMHNGSNVIGLNSRLLQLESQLSLKDEESFRLLVGRRFCELEKQLSIKDETDTKEKNKTEERINKLESKLASDINEKIEQIQQKNVSLFELNAILVKKVEDFQQKNAIMCELNVRLVKKVDAHTTEQIKIEERLDKLEEDNRELRKIIDDLRPTKSAYM